MDAELNGVDLTTNDSFANVVLCKNPNGFLISMPKNKKLFAKLVRIPGALYGDAAIIPYTIFLPREQFEAMKEALDGNCTWRNKSDLATDSYFLTQTQETLKNVLSRLDADLDLPYIKLPLRSFQKIAVSWAVEPKGKQGIRGGLLADEMGLGKTLEGIATACALKHDNKIKKCLIVCPATLKTQWEQEIEKFTYEDSVVIRSKNSKNAFQGRKQLYEKVEKENTFFTITNYELLIQREVKDKIQLKSKTKKGKKRIKKVYGDYLDLNEIKKLGFDMIIIDEAHRMQNPNTEIAKAIRQINSNYKLLMTGTPIEKELKNIFQLIDYLDPTIIFGEQIGDFSTRYERFQHLFLLKRLNTFSYPLKEIDVFGEKNITSLRKKINAFMLRRKTEDVSNELPTKIEEKMTVEFEATQKKLYDSVTKLMQDVDKKLKIVTDEQEREALDSKKKGLSQIRTIICDSPTSLLQSNSQLSKLVVGKRKNFPKTEKEERLIELVEEICIRNNQKVVIFTRYARVANTLSKYIGEIFKKHNKQRPFKHFVYEGKTEQGCKWRDELEKEGKDKSIAVCNNCPFYNQCETRTKYSWHFQNDNQTKVLIATDAGNYGVNLQKGKYLINYDLPDKFSIYLQRIGRIRRIGSEHDKVFVYDLVTKDGVDEKKHTILKKQMEINKKLIENKKEDKQAFEEINNLLQDAIDVI